MGKCWYCGRHGLLFRVSHERLCDRCAPLVKAEVMTHLKFIQSSANLVDKSKKIETRIGRIDDILNRIHFLEENYYSKGLKNPKIKDINYKQRLIKIRDQIINEGIEDKIAKILDKAMNLKTDKAKLNAANRALNTMNEFKDKYDYDNKELHNKIDEFINQNSSGGK